MGTTHEIYDRKVREMHGIGEVTKGEEAVHVSEDVLRFKSSRQ